MVPIYSVQYWHLSPDRCARKEPLFPSQFVKRLHQDMDIYFQSVLAPADKDIILLNIGDLR